MSINSNDCALTDDHIAFLRAAIEGYQPHDWRHSMAALSGSNRRFVRLQHRHDLHKSYMLVLWDATDSEWNRFIAIEKEVRLIHGVLPAIYYVDEKRGMILEEDVGSETLWTAVKESAKSDTTAVIDAYEQVIDTLIAWQSMSCAEVPSIASRIMDEEVFLWESGYFSYHCVKEYFGLDELLNASWEKERREIAKAAALVSPLVCIHRDFQSHNIIFTGKKVRFVDFQGARLGPAGYDLASLLYDPYVDFLEDKIVQELLSYYRKHSPFALDDRAFMLCSVQRLMQALGAYANLSLNKGKRWYRKYIPIAMARLCDIVGDVETENLRRIVLACRERFGGVGES